MHKKVWIAARDIILVRLRDYQDDKADVILKYMLDEARLLKAYGELSETTCLNEGIAGGLDKKNDGASDDYIEFEDEDTVSSSSSSSSNKEKAYDCIIAIDCCCGVVLLMLMLMKHIAYI
ncbi:hypothetical protein ACSBR1_030431 [Camellia fascicularis]